MKNIMKFLVGFKYAFRGLMLAIREQRYMKIHILTAVAITTIGWYVQFSYVDWCIATLTVGLVIGMEVINTSVEEIVNFISPERRVEAGRIKDLSAGAVLVVSLAALLVGIILIGSKINF